jgi:hypothetical protein
MVTNSARLDFDKLAQFSQYHLKCKLEKKEERAKILENVRALIMTKAQG